MYVRTFAAATLAVIVMASPDLYAQCQYATCQSEGAVQKPGGWDISLPFEEGETVRVLSGYGPLAGSGLHCRAQDSNCANDWYALDLILPDHPNSGKGQPVVAIAEGTVLDADWGSAGWANYGRRVYLTHDGGDGHTYTTMYAHLDSINVSNGQQISKGDVIGTLGQSCQEADSCSSFSTPHLHFAVHQDSNFGGSGSGGSYGGRAVIPEPIDGYSGLQKNDDLTSDNGGEDPPPMDDCDIVIGDTEISIEEDSSCGRVVGEPNDVSTGSGGHSYTATLAVPSPDYANGLIYVLQFAAAGSYDVWMNIPDGVATANEATYKVSYSGQSTKVKIDQAAASGTEVRLGRFDFDTTADQWIRLGDNYDDAANEGQTFVMDAVRLIPAELCDCDEPGTMTEACEGGGGTLESRCDGCWLEMISDSCPPPQNNSNQGTNNGNNSSTGNATPNSDPGNNNSGNKNSGNNNSGNNNSGSPEGDGDGQPIVVNSDGCACATGAGAGAPFVVFLLALVFGIRRRR